MNATNSYAGSGLGPLLEELAAADTFKREHHTVRYTEHPHGHLACPESYGDTPCPMCADWTECCRRIDRAIAAVTSYAHALVAKAQDQAAACCPRCGAAPGDDTGCGECRPPAGETDEDRFGGAR